MFNRTLPITLFALLTLSALPANASSPDRCATLGSDGYPALCEPIAEDLAWYWDGEVCCDAAGCELLTTRACATGTQTYSCEYATVDVFGNATCQFVVPRYCELNQDCRSTAELPETLPPQYTWGPFESAICCFNTGDCYPPEGGPCGGFLTWCDNGVSNSDGTVTCFDGEEDD